jgi:CO/xanthine dehydrogenase FAD-binding subunit
MGDIFASAEYRSAVAPVYVKRAIAAAVARAR